MTDDSLLWSHNPPRDAVQDPERLSGQFERATFPGAVNSVFRGRPSDGRRRSSATATREREDLHPARPRRGGMVGHHRADRVVMIPPRCCRVYHGTPSRTAEEIVRDGFTDRDPEHGEDKELPASVVLLDAPMFRDAYDLKVVAVDIPEAVVLPYEWITETRSHRRFMVPAEVVNKRGRVSNWETM
jgi:hypothetical protein